MATENVREEFYTEPDTTNKTASAAHVQTYYPITSNISGVVLNGQVIFELHTGFNEYLDLFKTHLSLDYRLIAGAGPAFAWNAGDCPLSNMIARGQMYINGIKVAASQNWTQDAVLSKRVNFSSAYNKAINGLSYVAASTVIATAPMPALAPGTPYIDTEYFDALFLRDETCIIPPNSNIRILLDIDSDYVLKMGLVNTAGAGTIAIDKLKLVAYTVVQTGAIPKDWMIKLITLNSFLSSISGVQEQRQYQVSPSVVKVACTFISDKYKTTDGAKVFAGNLLTYLNDDKGQTTALQTLDFKLNNIVIPNTRWDFSYGFKEAYTNYINETGGITDASCKETFSEWENYGKIHIANIVKPAEDKSNSLQVAVSFESIKPDAFMLVTSFEEQIVKIDYNSESGAVIGTSILV